MEQADLEREFVELARRVAAIEQRLSLGVAISSPPAALDEAPAATHAPIISAEMIPVLGRALMGLAGAYLLRGLTESGTLPQRAGVATGIAYAMLWLVWAARAPAAQRIEAALHSLTSVLVMAPLLWEATLRFHAISNWTAGGILLLFTVFGLAVSWKKNLLIVATIATLAGLGTAAALLVASHDVLPFTYLFLAIAAAVEVSACLDHWLNERWLAATAANLSVLFATWLATNPRGLPDGYAPIDHGWLLAAQVALLAIYLPSIIVRTLLRHFRFTVFETAQCAIVFLIAVGGGLRLTAAMAIPAVVCGLACYLVSFALLERQGRARNFYTYSTFGLLLILAGSRILMEGIAASTIWWLLALVCIWAGGRVQSVTLQVHGAVYLFVALAVSGGLKQAGAFLLSSGLPPSERLPETAGWLAACAIGYALALRYPGGRPDTWNHRAVRIGLAAVMAWVLAGVAAGALTAAYHATLGQHASHAYCATLRTGILAAGSLALAWLGARYKRSELSRLIYPTMLVGAYRLLAQDLRQDRTPAMFLSLLLYGAALIALPRLRKAAG